MSRRLAQAVTFTRPDEQPLNDSQDAFHWTAPKIVLSIFLFLIAGLAEIGGGWLVWQAVRVRGKELEVGWWRDPQACLLAAMGACALVSYGFLPTAQPPPTFGRLYAVYGGFFVILSFLWGWVVDGEKPDKGTLRLPAHQSDVCVCVRGQAHPACLFCHATGKLLKRTPVKFSKSSARAITVLWHCGITAWMGPLTRS